MTQVKRFTTVVKMNDWLAAADRYIKVKTARMQVLPHAINGAPIQFVYLVIFESALTAETIDEIIK